MKINKSYISFVNPKHMPTEDINYWAMYTRDGHYVETLSHSQLYCFLQYSEKKRSYKAYPRKTKQFRKVFDYHLGDNEMYVMDRRTGEVYARYKLLAPGGKPAYDMDTRHVLELIYITVDCKRYDKLFRRMFMCYFRHIFAKYACPYLGQHWVSRTLADGEKYYYTEEDE